MQRRRMRKGTRSCKNCRRRKARCVFRPELPSSCVDCLERGVPCRDQNSNDTESSPPDSVAMLSERVAHLESLVQSLSKSDVASLNNTAPHPVDYSNQFVDDTSTTLSSSRLCYHNNATILGLFDNAILTKKPESDNLAAHSRASNEGKMFKPILYKDLQVCRELLSLLPSSSDLKEILRVTGGWFISWRHLFGEIQADKGCNTLEQFVTSSFEQKNPLRVAIGLQCLAISLQSRSGFESQPQKLNLPLPSMELSNHYLTLVDRLVISDDDYVGSIEYTELVAMHAKCLVNLCKIRKSWVYFRRAISHAQLLGLHQNQNIEIEDAEFSSQRCKDGWWSLNILDRYTSLLLGLPYAASLELDELDIKDIGAGKDVLTVLYHRKLAVIAGMVIDRNQKSSPSLSSTMEIQRKLDEITGMLPDSWWMADLSVARRQLDPETCYKRLKSQHWASQIRIFLHLPFTFQSAIEPGFEYNRLACFDAARKASKLYHILRQDSEAAFHMCTILDFSGFLAALILLLGRIQTRLVRSPHDTLFQQEDESIIDATSAILLKASTEPGCTVAVEGLQVLETLKGLTKHSDESQDRNIQWEGTLIVPYFGKIKISPGKSFQSQRRGSSEKYPGASLGAHRTLIGEAGEDDALSHFNDVSDFLEPNVAVEFPQIDIDWRQMLNIGDMDEAWNIFAN